MDENVRGRLDQLATFWGIANDVAAARAKLASVKAAESGTDLSDDNFAIVQEHEGKAVRKYASYDAVSTVDAAEAFFVHRHRYPYAWRKQAAERLLKSAEEHRAVLPAFLHTYLLKAAAFASADPEAVDEALVQRMNIAHKRDDDVMDKVAALLDKVAQAPEGFDREMLTQVLDTVDQADREIKLAQHYETKRVCLPEEMLVVRNTKVASEPIHLVNGRSIDPSLLTKEALAAVDDTLADMPMSKVAEILPTLPRPEADLLARLLPTTKTASTQPVSPAAAAPVDTQAPDLIGKGPEASAANTLNDGSFGGQNNFDAQMKANGIDPNHQRTSSELSALGVKEPVANHSGELPQGQIEHINDPAGGTSSHTQMPAPAGMPEGATANAAATPADGGVVNAPDLMAPQPIKPNGPTAAAAPAPAPAAPAPAAPAPAPAAPAPAMAAAPKPAAPSMPKMPALGKPAAAPKAPAAPKPPKLT